MKSYCQVETNSQKQSAVLKLSTYFQISFLSYFNGHIGKLWKLPTSASLAKWTHFSRLFWPYRATKHSIYCFVPGFFQSPFSFSFFPFLSFKSNNWKPKMSHHDHAFSVRRHEVVWTQHHCANSIEHQSVDWGYQ